MNCTSIKQSKKLVELGLNSDTADMFYLDTDLSIRIHVGDYEDRKQYKNWDTVPCWSVGALIDLMPSCLTDDINCDYSLSIGKGYVEYINHNVSALYSTYHSEIGTTTLESCYNMVVWLLENNYIEKIK